MSCEPVPTTDVFELAHTALANQMQPTEITLPSGYQVRLWDSLSTQIGVSIHKNGVIHNFKVQTRDSATRWIPHVVMVCRVASAGYCPDLVYLGPLSGFKNAQHILLTIIQAVTAFADAGYTIRAVNLDGGDSEWVSSYVHAHIYCFKDNKLTRQTFKFSSGSRYAVRVHVANKLQQIHDFDGFGNGG